MGLQSHANNANSNPSRHQRRSMVINCQVKAFFLSPGAQKQTLSLACHYLLSQHSFSLMYTLTKYWYFKMDCFSQGPNCLATEVTEYSYTLQTDKPIASFCFYSVFNLQSIFCPWLLFFLFKSIHTECICQTLSGHT